MTKARLSGALRRRFFPLALSPAEAMMRLAAVASKVHLKPLRPTPELRTEALP